MTMFQQPMTNVFLILAATAFGTLHVSSAFAQDDSCGVPRQRPGETGPFDYRTATAQQKHLVESYHFTKDVENLRKGTTSTLGADIAYTLFIFPNHPRALLALSKLGEKTKSAQPPGAKLSIDCFFVRAVRWRPDDPVVRLLFGIHLTRRGQKDAAHAQLEVAEQNAVENANFHYNLGLAFLDVNDADRALTHAWRAYALGYDLHGLRNRLEKIGKWRDQ